MNNTDMELAMGKLASDMLKNCCEYLYLSGGMSEKDAALQAKIKAASIQNDILREIVTAKQNQNDPEQVSGGARRSNPDAELPLIEEAQIVRDPVKEQEADELFKDLGGNPGDTIRMQSAKDFADQNQNNKDLDSMSPEEIIEELRKTQGPGDSFLILGF